MSTHARFAAWRTVAALVCAAICAPSNAQSSIDTSNLAGVPLTKAVRSMRDIRYSHIVGQRYDYSCGSAALATLSAAKALADAHPQQRAPAGCR